MTYDVTAARRLLAAAPDLVRVRSWLRKDRPVARRREAFGQLPPVLQPVTQAIDDVRSVFDSRIGLVHVELGGQLLPVPTAWACGPNRMVTAGHVLSIFLRSVS